MVKGTVIFNDNTCKGCNLCVVTCKQKILKLDKSRVNQKGYNPAMCIDLSKCTGCAMCAIICPDSVIKVERE